MEEPAWIPVKERAKEADYVDSIKKAKSMKSLSIVVVIIGDKKQKASIKKTLDGLGIPSQFAIARTLI